MKKLLPVLGLPQLTQYYDEEKNKMKIWLAYDEIITGSPPTNSVL